MNGRTKLFVVATGLIVVLAIAFHANAGCGCDKPPPPVAPIRPAFASPNAPVTLVGESLVEGQAYVVRFQGWDPGGGTPEASVVGVATVKRDFADGTPKPQVVVTAPALGPGPTSVTVTPQVGGPPVLEIPSSDFTILQATLFLDEVQGQTTAKCYRAAIAADGTMYLPLDIEAITERMIFLGRVGGYRFTFGPQDVVIYNTQGVVMQLLSPETAGLYTIDDAPDPEESTDGDDWGRDKRSFRMSYDRHEFKSYRERHATDPNFLPDPSDPDWHVNGTRHIDHDHLVMAIRGLVDQVAPPAPGVTPAFTFRVTTIFADLVNGPRSTTHIQWSDECGAQPPGPPAAPVAAPRCAARPAVGCRQRLMRGQARLDVSDSVKDERDKIFWKWKNGQETAPGNFGDPGDADGVTLCAYDESGETPVLIFEAGVPANEGCKGNGSEPCWTGKGTPRGLRGFTYRNESGKPDGIEHAALAPGRDGHSQLAIQGRGHDLDLPALPLPLPLRVQLQSAAGQCWETTFSPDGVRKNTDERFQGKAD